MTNSKINCDLVSFVRQVDIEESKKLKTGRSCHHEQPDVPRGHHKFYAKEKSQTLPVLRQLQRVCLKVSGIVGKSDSAISAPPGPMSWVRGTVLPICLLAGKQTNQRNSTERSCQNQTSRAVSLPEISPAKAYALRRIVSGIRVRQTGKEKNAEPSTVPPPTSDTVAGIMVSHSVRGAGSLRDLYRYARYDQEDL